METHWIALGQNKLFIAKTSIEGESGTSFDEGELDTIESNRESTLSYKGIIGGEFVLAVSRLLPQTHPKELPALLAYALEDSLLEAPSAYHVTITQSHETGQTEGLIVKKDYLEGLLADPKIRHGLTELYPDYALLPYERGHWALYLSKEKAWLRYGLIQGAVVERPALGFFLTGLLDSHSMVIAPELCHVWGEPLSAQETAILGSPIQMHATASFDPDRPLWLQGEPFHFRHLNPSFNILLGAFKPKAEKNRVKLLKQVALAGLSSLGFLFISLAIVQVWIFKDRDEGVQKKITALYHQVYPEATAVVAPKLRLSQTLKRLQGGGASQQGFLPLLYVWGQAQASVPGTVLKRFNYDERRGLGLTFLTPDFNHLTALKTALPRTIMLKQQSATQINNQVKVTWWLEETPS